MISKIIRRIFTWRKGEIAFLRAVGRKYVRSRYGVLMRANWDDSTFRYCYFGAYGVALSAYLESITKKFIFLDIGANQGLYSIIACKNPNCLKVIAFEPVSSTFSILVDNIRANECEDDIMPIHAAISSDIGFAKIFIKKGHSGGAFLNNRENVRTQTEFEKVRLINSVEVDALLDIEGDVIIKIDVEGHEDVIINELLNSKNFHRVRAIFYEVDERWNNPVEIEETLRDNNFSEFQKFGEGYHYDVLALR